MENKIIELLPPQFPSLLKEINDPPKKLYARGSFPDQSMKVLCVVGSRKHSDYGRLACEKLIGGLRGHGIVIVSGLALGIDTIAHSVALKTGLKTVAVPGSGLDWNCLYPSLNRGLAKRILEAGGMLLSEFEPSFKATPWSFPQRNRLMVGLSNAVLLIEAEEKSGTLITAKLASEYNRELGIVPGSIFSKTSAGTHQFLRLGATPVTKSGDILELLGIASEIKNVAVSYEKYGDDAVKIVELLQNPLSRDELVIKSNMNAKDVNMILSILEIDGAVEESLGKIYLK